MARRVEELRNENGGSLPVYAWPGGYPVIYWAEENGEIFLLCGDCAESILQEDDTETHIVAVESGDHYEEDLPCEHCGKQLAAYIDW